MEIKHFLQFNDLSRDELDYLFQRTAWIKAEFKAYRQYWPLVDRTLVMIFEKASTRTRLKNRLIVLKTLAIQILLR